MSFFIEHKGARSSIYTLPTSSQDKKGRCHHEHIFRLRSCALQHNQPHLQWNQVLHPFLDDGTEDSISSDCAKYRCESLMCSIRKLVGTNIGIPRLRQIIEIIPPSVGTDLHRERENPDDNKQHKGAKSSLTIEEFMADFIDGCENNHQEICAGSAKDLAKAWQDAFGKQYQQAASNYKR